MVEISVLMYTFNSEIFIKDSLDSLLNQTFNDFEIFCINDESTDNSINILNDYSNKKNINVFSIKHTGFSNVINQFLDKVHGKYLYIMTPEVILKENALEMLYNKSEELKTDFVMLNSDYFDEVNNKHFDKNDFFMKNMDSSLSDGFKYEDINDLVFNMDTSLSNILFRISFIKENGISCPETVSYGEDVFFFNSLLSAQKIFFFKDKLITHRMYYTSLTKRKDSHLLDSIPIFNMILDVFDEKNELKNFKHSIYEHKMNRIIGEYYKIKEEYKEEYFSLLKQDFINILNDEKNINDFIENISSHNRKFFEQVLISENCYELNLLTKTYYDMLEYYQLIEEEKYLQPIADEK